MRGPWWLRALVHVGVLAPLFLLARDFTLDRLTANPVQEIQLRTGRYALNLLALTLAARPVAAVSGFSGVLRLQRTLGLYAFLYASLHLLNFVGLDYRFDFALLGEDISGKRFVLAGLAAFVILLALAATSTAGWKERLGVRWHHLHRLVYAAALLAALHFIWQAKADLRAPLLYAAIVVLLLAVRIPPVARALRRG